MVVRGALEPWRLGIAGGGAGRPGRDGGERLLGGAPSMLRCDLAGWPSMRSRSRMRAVARADDSLSRLISSFLRTGARPYAAPQRSPSRVLMPPGEGATGSLATHQESSCPVHADPSRGVVWVSGASAVAMRSSTSVHASSSIRSSSQLSLVQCRRRGSWAELSSCGTTCRTQTTASGSPATAVAASRINGQGLVVGMDGATRINPSAVRGVVVVAVGDTGREDAG